MGLAKLEALEARREVWVDGDHHSQRNVVKRLLRARPDALAEGYDRIGGEPVEQYDAALHAPGTVTRVYLPQSLADELAEWRPSSLAPTSPE